MGNEFGRIIGVENSDRNEFSSCVISPHAVSSFDEIMTMGMRGTRERWPIDANNFDTRCIFSLVDVFCMYIFG